jgi:membrane-bound lytic murein transglycosylase F
MHTRKQPSRRVCALLLLLCVAAPTVGAQMRRPVDRYDEDFRKYSKRLFGPAFDWRWFKAQGMAESNLDSTARSYVGARGLMQLMPDTFREIASKNPELERIDDPAMNIAAGIAYDRRLWLQWESDSIDADRARFMFASYNAGRGTVRNAQKLARAQSLDARLWPNIETIAPKVPRWRHAETIGYVRKITAYIGRLDDRGRVLTDDVTVRGLRR